MSTHIPAALEALVRERAGDVCEYCRLPQIWQEARFHVDHIRPRKVGGQTAAGNLALACVSCSLRKAARTHAIDPQTLKQTRLFHPRRHRWAEHFQWTHRWHIVGTTAFGRATIIALRMNRFDIVRVRRRLARIDEFPPEAVIG